MPNSVMALNALAKNSKHTTAVKLGTVILPVKKYKWTNTYLCKKPKTTCTYTNMTQHISVKMINYVSSIRDY